MDLLLPAEVAYHRNGGVDEVEYPGDREALEKEEDAEDGIGDNPTVPVLDVLLGQQPHTNGTYDCGSDIAKRVGALHELVEEGCEKCDTERRAEEQHQPCLPGSIGDMVGFGLLVSPLVPYPPAPYRRNEIVKIDENITIHLPFPRYIHIEEWQYDPHRP